MKVNNVVMMASWLFELLVTRAVINVLVSFEQCIKLLVISFCKFEFITTMYV